MSYINGVANPMNKLYYSDDLNVVRKFAGNATVDCIRLIGRSIPNVAAARYTTTSAFTTQAQAQAQALTDTE